jgi:YD repeat-containing protein
VAYSYDQIFAADPANPANIAQNAAITIFAPGDVTMTPLTITDPDGQPLANPIPVNANGFGSAFAHATLDRVAWAGGGFTGYFTSYDGMKAEAVAARTAATTAQALAETAQANAASSANSAADAAAGYTFQAAGSILYDTAGNVTSLTEGGITTTFTYNTDGTVNTETRLGKVRTWSYDANGNPTSSTVV